MRGTIVTVKKEIRVFHSHEEADKGDAAYYRSLTPKERVEITLELFSRRHPDAAQQRFARVCRLIKLEQS